MALIFYIIVRFSVLMCSSKLSSSVRIDLKRCLCIHSLAQLIDVALQSLLYQRQLIPEPVPSLLQSQSHAAELFRTNYEKIQQILRDTFRSVNGGGRIREFVILMGGTPFSPKEIYRIQIPNCRAGKRRAEEDEKEDEKEGREETEEEEEGRRKGRGGGCCGFGGGGTNCEELNAKEKRLVFSAVALSKTAVAHFEGCKVPGKTDKVFLFIRTRSHLESCADGLEEDDSFELPDTQMQRKRKINQMNIQVSSPCCRREMVGTEEGEEGKRKEKKTKNDDDDVEAADEEDEEGDENAEPVSLWYRLHPFIANLN